MPDTETLPFRTERDVAGYHLFFEWHGGPYIDIGFTRGSAFDVINVWDYAAGAPGISSDYAAFTAQVEEYVNDPERDHAHDLRNFALYG